MSWPDRFASIWKVTFAVCESVKEMTTWPVEVSAGVAKFWLLPLFGHSIAAPPEAAESLTTTKGENRLCPERLSSSTTRLVLLPEELLLEDELELLLELEELLDEELEAPDEELFEDELLELEDELELLELEDEELATPDEELLLVDELELEELLLEDELLELEELEELLLELPPVPTHAGAWKLPSWLPCTPMMLPVEVPGLGNCQVQPAQLLNWKLVPVPAVQPAELKALVTVTVSGKFSVIVQPVIGVLPVLVMAISTWKKVPCVLEGVAVQPYEVPEPPLVDEELELEELLLDELEELAPLVLEEVLLDEDELELLELEELLEEEVEVPPQPE